MALQQVGLPDTKTNSIPFDLSPAAARSSSRGAFARVAGRFFHPFSTLPSRDASPVADERVSLAEDDERTEHDVLRAAREEQREIVTRTAMMGGDATGPRARSP